MVRISAADAVHSLKRTQELDSVIFDSGRQDHAEKSNALLEDGRSLAAVIVADDCQEATLNQRESSR